MLGEQRIRLVYAYFIHSHLYDRNATKPIDYLFKTTIPVKGEKLSDGWLMGNAIYTIMLVARTVSSDIECQVLTAIQLISFA